MTLSEVWALVGSGVGLVIILFSLIKIKPLEINIWSWLLRKIGKAFQGDVIDAMSDLNTKVDNLETKVDNLDAKMTNHELKDEENVILSKRKDILTFADEIYSGQYHSREHFEEILSFIDDYEDYYETHPLFENNKALIAIELITKTYKKCLEEHKFN